MIIEWLQRVFFECLMVLGASAPYLLVGFSIAGLMKGFLSDKWVQKKLGNESLGSVFWASLYGVPLPLCSCSVIPTAMALKRGGASKSATTAFMISTPETGVDSILISYGLLGPFMAIVRPIAAFITALLAGLWVSIGVRKKWLSSTEPSSDENAESHCDHDHGEEHDHQKVKVQEEPSTEAEPCCSGTKSRGVIPRIQEGLRYGFGTLLDDLTPWLLIGFALSGLIVTLVPDTLFRDVIPIGLMSSLLMMLIGTPLYICATASTPIAAALIAKGLDPGAALVFLLVGPATNITTLLVVYRFLGRGVLAVYLATIVVMSLAIGAVVNRIVAVFGSDLIPIGDVSSEHSMGFIAWGASIIFSLFLLRSAFRIRLARTWSGQINHLTRKFGVDLSSRFVRGAFVVILLVSYASTMVSNVGTGETGWVTRFGKITQGPFHEPGLHVHAPYPFETMMKSDRDMTRRVLVGTRDEPIDLVMAAEAAEESEVRSGDENLISIGLAVHYRVQDPYRYAFCLNDADRLVSELTQSSLRRVVATENGLSLLVETRPTIAPRVRALLSEELNHLGSGLEIVAVTLVSAHAPEAVHYEFRDVASALEYREQLKHQADGDAAELLMRAESSAFSTRQRALRDAENEVAQAQADAEVFFALASTYQSDRKVSSTLAYYEMLERVMKGVRQFWVMGEGVEIRKINSRGTQAVLSDNDSDEGGVFEDFEFPEERSKR